MKPRLHHSLPALLLFMCCIRIVFADWSGFPLVTNNVYKYDDARTNYGVISQLWNAAQERSEAAGVASMTNIETWTVSTGYSNEVIINVVGSVTNIYTNTYLLEATVNTTNQIGSFAYIYTDPQGTFTNTAWSYVTHDFMSLLDAKIVELIPYYVKTNEMDTNGTFNTWFDSGSVSFPMYTQIDLFETLGIGIVTRQTNAFNVRETNALWTARLGRTQNWLIAELEHTNTDWQFRDVGDFTLDFYDTNVFPVLNYTAGGTNAMVALTVTVQGMALFENNNPGFWIQRATNETFVTSLNSYNLSNRWYSITNISCATTPANSNDVLSVVWNDYIAFYSTGFEYRITSTVLDERYKILNELRQTTQIVDLYQNTNGAGASDWVWYGASAFETNWPTATNNTEADWQSISSVTSLHSAIGSYGVEDGNNGEKRGYIASFQAQNYVTNLTTNYSKVIDYYLLSSAGPLAPVAAVTETNLYTNWSLNLREDLYTYFNSATGLIGTHSVTSSIWGSTQTWNYAWCPEPFNSSGFRFDGRSCLGFDLDGKVQKAVIDWAVTNGFTQQ